MEFERRMDQEVRRSEVTTPVICTACGESFTADRWQPRMRCPHCERIGYPDQAGFNLLPLGWICAVCEHENNGLTNFCVNCGEGLTSRCVRCEGAVYSAACTECGTLQEPLVRRKAMLDHREQRFREIRTHVIVQRAQQEASKPAAHHNPNYGVAGWRSLDIGAPKQEDQPEAATEPALPTPPASSNRPATSPAPKKRRRGLSNQVRGLIIVLIGLAFVIWNAFGSEIRQWVSEVVSPTIEQTFGTSANSPEMIFLGVSIVLGLILIPAVIWVLSRVSRLILNALGSGSGP